MIITVADIIDALMDTYERYDAGEISEEQLAREEARADLLLYLTLRGRWEPDLCLVQMSHYDLAIFNRQHMIDRMCNGTW